MVAERLRQEETQQNCFFPTPHRVHTLKYVKDHKSKDYPCEQPVKSKNILIRKSGQILEQTEYLVALIKYSR